MHAHLIRIESLKCMFKSRNKKKMELRNIFQNKLKKNQIKVKIQKINSKTNKIEYNEM